MVLPEFNALMIPFLETFGRQNYPEPKLRLIWSEVSDLNPSQFRRVVETLIGEFSPEFPPRVSAFRELAHGERKIALNQSASDVSRSVLPTPQAASYRSADEALGEVESFYRTMLQNLSQLQEPKDFGEIAARYFPEEKAEVDHLKNLVRTGDDKARLQYVEKAKLLIVKVTARAVMPGLGWGA